VNARRIKKFYKAVSVEHRHGRHAILLDGKAAKTPAHAELALPTRALADAVADEWRGEGEMVDFDTLALTRLAATAIDLGPRESERWIENIVAYLKSDLLCYRAGEPSALVQRQEEVWSPYVAWAERALGVPLCITVGVGHVPQPDEAVARAEDRLAAMGVWSLIGTKSAADIAGSAILGLALEARAFSPEEIFAASRLDERYQQERWGVDDMAKHREGRLEAEFHAVDRWFRLLKPTA
jgi:chaperone required for assembly of F1-ATPase